MRISRHIIIFYGKGNSVKRVVICILCAIIFLLAGGTSYANSQQYQSDTLEIYFRQGYSIWEPHYKQNGENLLQFIERFAQHRTNNVFNRISKINIVAGCSPEGSWRHNQTLSKKRAATMRKVLGNYISLPDSVVVEDARGINWSDLRRMVVEDENMPYKQEVLDHIDNSPEVVINSDGKLVETRKLRLMYLKDGIPWRYMYEKFFPVLRSFNLVIAIEWEKVKTVRLEEMGGAIPAMQPASCASVVSQNKFQPKNELPQPQPERAPHYIALKTNLLYDLAAIPNIGAEFYLGRNWSLSGDWMYAWWKHDMKHWYWRVYGGELGIRKWFGRAADEKPLTGHHLGVYGQLLTYDIEMGGRGYMGGVPGGTLWDKASYGVGLEYGYAKPIGKRLNLDFTIGLGYLGGEYREYIPQDDCYVWQATKYRHWFGPTKAEISLVWLLGYGNINKSKARR